MTPVERAIRRAAEAAVAGIAAFNRRRRGGGEFLVGVHRPLTAALTLEGLPVSGTIPPALHGRYLKMGANPVRPDPAAHWFLGDGMVHEVSLGGGRAPGYRNRWIRSRPAAAALGEAPAPGPRRGRSDTVNTNVVALGGRPFALVEAGSFPVRLWPTINDQSYDDLDGTLHGAFSGHPHRDPRTGEQHVVAYDADVRTAVRHVMVGPDGRVRRDLAIPVRDGPCVHDCAVTSRYVVVPDLPVTFSMRAVLGGHDLPFRWNPRHPARLGLLPREGTAAEIIWCDVEPCFVFHIANAFDDGARVVLDVVAYPTMFAGAGGGPDAVGRLERWTADPLTRRVERRRLHDAPVEFPRIDERRTGQPHRVVYAVAVPPDGNTQLRGATRLFAIDTVAGTSRAHDFGANRVPGEFVFVPDEASAEAGWLLGLVLDADAGTTDLVILDARQLEPVAAVHLPHAIPPGFHGNWFPA